ncbi:MAG: glutathione S-transferase family protein [Burkholderiales bacterium]|nr:glutathione S-transferase family protein [Burkholderiales bacterium]
MFKLHGSVFSNYYNKVKLALLEKGVAFDEIAAKPSQDTAYLVQCPTGKIPYFEVEAGRFCESQAALEYLEERYPDVPLLPADLLARAKVRELIQIAEQDVELVARRALAHVLYGAPLADAVKDEIARGLDRGMASLSRVVRYAPWAAGDQFTMADCALAAHIPLITWITKAVYGRDWFEGTPAADYLGRMKQRPSYQRVRADLDAARAAQAR